MPTEHLTSRFNRRSVCCDGSFTHETLVLANPPKAFDHVQWVVP